MRSRFEPSVLEPDPERRGPILGWLEAGLRAVEPERLTRQALIDRGDPDTVLIAIGKAAPAMARGAASVLRVVGGVCVSDHVEAVPDGIQLVIGDHPVPGTASLVAAHTVLDTVRATPPETRIIALISGGGSALCEMPRPGVPASFLSEVNRRLIATGTKIEEINLVRAHLSAIKCGGVSLAAQRPIETLVLSDMAGADPGLVASGPTVPRDPDPEMAEAILNRASITVPDAVRAAMSKRRPAQPMPEMKVLADGLTAAHAVRDSVPPPVAISPDWLQGAVESCLNRFFANAGGGVTIGVGETVVDVTGPGRGGRSTHACLIASQILSSTDDVFVAFATDGVDGPSGAAGAIVDGSTVARGGDPHRALEDFDSARYLSATSDLLRCPPTGTNVSDMWILWRPTPTAT